MNLSEFVAMLVKELQLEEPCTEDVELSLRLKCLKGQWNLVVVDPEESRAKSSSKKRKRPCKPCTKK